MEFWKELLQLLGDLLCCSPFTTEANISFRIFVSLLRIVFSFLHCVHCDSFQFLPGTEFPTGSGGGGRKEEQIFSFIFLAIEMCALNSFVSSCLDTVNLLPIELFCLPCFLRLYPRDTFSE